jgi:hypothetical protein
MLAFQTVILQMAVFIGDGNSLGFDVYQENSIFLIHWTRIILQLIKIHQGSLAFLCYLFLQKTLPPTPFYGEEAMAIQDALHNMTAYRTLIKKRSRAKNLLRTAEEVETYVMDSYKTI